MNVNLNDLNQNKYGDKYEEGYRIVYFYDNYYRVGEYCKTIEGFMISFAECDPIIDDDDIPDFISTNDLLNRYLKELNDVVGVAIYDINGECIDRVNKNYKKKSLD